MIQKVVILACLLFLSACAPQGPEELDRLMKEDPAFKRTIIARDQIHTQIRVLKQDLLGKKRVIDAEVDKLRAEYDAYAKAQNQKVEKYQAAVDANRNLMQRELETAAAQLGAKKTELEGYQKTLADVKKVLKESRGINISSEEKEKWEERVLMLSEKIRPLTEEIRELDLGIRLKKRKIHYLK